MSITDQVSHWLRKDASTTRVENPSAYAPGVSARAVTLDGIRETRARLGDRIHVTTLLSAAAAARVAGEAAGVRIADGIPYHACT
jgi:hypothetical protein